MKPTNEHKIAVLRIVRRDIETRRVDFLCHALDDIIIRLYGGSSHKAAAVELKEYVKNAIPCRKHSTQSLWNWLLEEGHVTTAQYRNSQPRQRVTRLAWIDWMIEQLEKP